MALYFRKKAVLAKIEAAYGTDAAPTGLADAVLASEVSIQPMQGADADRGLVTPYLGANETIPYDLHMVMTFRVELAGSGTAGTAPAWGPLLRACGTTETVVADTSVAYAPLSNQDAHESLTLYLNMDGVLFALAGARGDATLTVDASGIPVWEFTFTGLWTKPTDAALPTADTSAWQKPLVASCVNTPTFTIDGAARVMRNFSLALGNQVEPRFLVNRCDIIIVDRAEMVEAQIEMTDVATWDPFAKARDQVTSPIVLEHGTVAGSIATLEVPTAQVMRPGDPTEAQGVVELPLRFAPLPATGDDQWSLTLT